MAGFFQLGPTGSPRRRLIFFAVTGVLVMLILVFFRDVLAPFALALILAYVLAPLVEWLQRIRVGRFGMPRWAAVLVVYTTLLSGMGAALAFGVPRVVAETQRLALEAPRAIHTAQTDWLPRLETALRSAQQFYTPANEEELSPSDETPAEPPPPEREQIEIRPTSDGEGYQILLPSQGVRVVSHSEREFRITTRRRQSRSNRDLNSIVMESLRRTLSETEASATTIIREAQALIATVVSGVFTFFIILMLSAYMLVTSDRIVAFFRSLAEPGKRTRFDRLVTRIDKGLAGVVRGQLLIALVNGVLSGVGFWLADLRYWPILTLLATVLSIIPIFGAIISSIPAVLIGLQQSIGTALFTLAWIVGIHQLEANVLNPKIMGDAAKVHPVLVVFALLAGEHFFGIAGALLAVPVLSIVQSLFLHFREVALGVPKTPALAAQWAEATLDRQSQGPPPPQSDGDRSEE